ncbi:PP2C-domain-containing protein, partial [Artomyces pyxidatus]
TDKHTEFGGDSRFSYGVSEMQGWRISMEDAHTISLKLEEGDQTNAFFAVYDGHGGGTAAEFAGRNVHDRLVREEAYREQNYPEALKRAFLGTDEDMLSDPTCIRDPSGCTAVAALITKDTIYVANAGDSRSVMSVNGSAKPLSYDHKPENETEKNRVVAAGGYIEYGRVNGNLALARALGDFEYKKNYSLTPEKQIVTADPDVIAHEINLDEDEFVVLACDGIWDCLTSQEVVNVVRLQVSQGAKLQDICENLCDLCLAPDTRNGAGIGCDNMTVLIVALLNGKTLAEWYAKIKERVENQVGYKTPDTLPRIYAQSRLLDRQRQVGISSNDIHDRFLQDPLNPAHSPYPLMIQLFGGGGKINEINDFTQEDLMWTSSDKPDDSDEDDDDIGEHHSDDTEDGEKSLKQQLEEFEREDREEYKMDEADDDAFNQPFDSVIDLSQAEKDRAETRVNGAYNSSTLTSHTTPVEGEAPPPPKPLPNGDAKPQQLAHNPGGDEFPVSASAEGFLDGSEDPLKA